ncbi:MAG TPA: hypothetical protein DEQ09_12935 [Bacteroidales bacterium]|nr:hypothetical protein [Bacteroidales bacterium]
MKPIRRLHYSIILISTFFLATGLTHGQDYEKTFKWSFDANNDVQVFLGNYDSDLEIRTWDKQEIELHMIIDAEIRKEEDARKIDDYITGMEFENSPETIRLDTRFWKSITSIMGFTTMKLKNNESVRIKRFNMECKLWIPENASLELSSKYSEINMEDIGGELEMDLYNDDLFAGSVGGKATIKAKYSEMNFTSMKNIIADLYSCELETADAGDIKITTKYSDIQPGDVGILNIESYEDDLIFGNCGDIRFIAKYSDLEAGRAGKLVAKTYEGELKIEEITDGRIESKYTDYQINKAGIINIISFYEGGLESEKLISLDIQETKYAKYSFEELDNELNIVSAYEDEISVGRLGTGLKKLNIDGRYLDIELGLAFNYDCRLKASIKYPDLNIDDDIFKTKIHIKEGSDLEYEGIKGTEKEGMPEFIISGYEVNLSISEY